MSSEAARAYNLVGPAYLAYADGDGGRPFEFGSRYAYGDRQIWAAIDAEMQALAASGQRTLEVLDAGCGPGTWLRRIVARARVLGFTRITGRGFDVSARQVELARELSADARRAEGVSLRFDVADIVGRLPEADRSVDLCLCLYGVLNHVERRDHRAVAAELARVTRGALLATVRTIGSQPTIYVDGIEAAAEFHQDNTRDRLTVELRTGGHIEFNSHLFCADEMERLFAPHVGDIRLTGLDLFHGRFAPDSRWNATAHRDEFWCDLEALERTYCTDPLFIDHATHLMLVAAAAPKRDP
jgi:SAM-dependent methyltransferase